MKATMSRATAGEPAPTVLTTNGVRPRCRPNNLIRAKVAADKGTKPISV
ncbi:MAG: hypothetical protein U0802_18930 [Candidatus Binatia bacterium]